MQREREREREGKREGRQRNVHYLDSSVICKLIFLYFFSSLDIALFMTSSLSPSDSRTSRTRVGIMKSWSKLSSRFHNARATCMLSLKRPPSGTSLTLGIPLRFHRASRFFDSTWKKEKYDFLGDLLICAFSPSFLVGLMTSLESESPPICATETRFVFSSGVKFICRQIWWRNHWDIPVVHHHTIGLENVYLSLK